MSQSNVEIVDDRDPRVEYLGAWDLAGVIEEYNSTTHGAYTAGSRVTFTFKGSSVEVFGTISNSAPYTNAPRSTYSLDGSSPQTFNPPFPDKIYYRLSFFKSPLLEDEQHVLTITSTVSNSAFWLDYFEIVSNGLSTPPPPPSSSSSLRNPVTPSTHAPSTTFEPATGSSTGSSSSSARESPQAPANTSSSFAPTLGSVSQSSSSSTPADPSNISASSSALPTKNTAPIGAIVGGVIGGVALILLVCLAILCFRRRRRPRRASSGSSIRPDRSSFGTHQPPPSNNWEGENTRFIGDVSPFTGHWTSESSTDGRSHVGEPINPQEMRYLNYSVTASRKAERPEGGVEDLYNLDVPPRYS